MGGGGGEEEDDEEREKGFAVLEEMGRKGKAKGRERREKRLRDISLLRLLPYSPSQRYTCSTSYLPSMSSPFPIYDVQRLVFHRKNSSFCSSDTVS